MSHYIALCDGTPYYYGKKNPQVKVETIAHHLSINARFCGGTRLHYSIAAHSLHVCDIVEQWGGSPYERMGALLHDGHEAVISDIPTPYERWLDELSGGGDFLSRSKKLLDADIIPVLGLPYETFVACRDVIKDADIAALVLEGRNLSSPVPTFVMEGHFADELYRIESVRGTLNKSLCPSRFNDDSERRFVAKHRELLNAITQQQQKEEEEKEFSNRRIAG